MDEFKGKLDSFLAEFNKIKTENEPTAIAYMDKLKGLLEEGEEHIKDIDAKIPKDLKTVKEEIRTRYTKLKFMIKEYRRDHASISENYELIKNKSSKVLKRMANMNEITDEDAEIKRLEDEKAVLQKMIDRMKRELATTNETMNQRLFRLEKIHKLSQANKLDLLEYYNKLDALCIYLENVEVKGGDVSGQLRDIITYTDKQDELIDVICSDLLSSPHTSTNLVTVNQIESYFKANRESIYRSAFNIKERTVFNLFGRTMYYLYYYLLLDRLMFEKKYAIPYIMKDDSKLSKDIRLLNYIEEALKEGSVEEAHVFAMQLSPKIKKELTEFMEL